MLDRTLFETPGKMSFAQRITRYLRQFTVLINIIRRAQEVEKDIQELQADGDPHAAYRTLEEHNDRLRTLGDKIYDWVLAQHQHLDDLKAAVIHEAVASGKLPGLPGDRTTLLVAQGIWKPGDVITIEEYKLFPDGGNEVLMVITKTRAVIPVDHLQRLK